MRRWPVVWPSRWLWFFVALFVAFVVLECSGLAEAPATRAPTPSGRASVVVEQTRVIDESDRTLVVGQVRNTSPSRQDNVWVTVTLYDADGAVVAVERAAAAGAQGIPSGGVAPFRVVLSRPVARFVRYTATVEVFGSQSTGA